MITVVAETHALDEADAHDYRAFCYEASLSDGSTEKQLEYAYLIWVNLPDMTRQEILNQRGIQSKGDTK